MFTQELFKILLPIAVAWAEEQEKIILRDGIQLTDSQIADARQLKISQPNKVRLMSVPSIPMPEEPSIKAAIKATQLISPLTAGLTVRYGIFIRSDCWRDRKLLVHELVHTSQYERLGGFFPFLEEYLRQCITIGYPAAPMEQEAIRLSSSICGQ
jgi:hypothetical protein